MTRQRAKRGEALLFLKSATLADHDECVLWPFSRTNDYGAVGDPLRPGKMALAHRASLVLFSGVDPTDKEAEHLCGRRLCVNPRHLKWSTSLENIRRKKEHGTQSFGEIHAAAKLTEIQAKEILASSDNHVSLAARYGVSKSQIGNIKSGKKWRHLSDGNTLHASD